MNLKRKLTFGVAALATVAFAGGAYAASQDPANPRQAFLNDVAKRLNVTPAQLNAALSGAYQDQLQAAVKAGKLTQAQANALKQRLDRGGLPMLGMHLFFMFGGRHGAQLDAAATYLGLTATQLRDQLMAGKSLAQVAAAQHKSVAGLKAAITAALKARFDKLVSAGVLTAVQEQRILTRLAARLDSLINRPGLFHGFRGEWHHMWPSGPAGPPAGAGFAPPPAPPGAPGMPY